MYYVLRDTTLNRTRGLVFQYMKQSCHRLKNEIVQTRQQTLKLWSHITAFRLTCILDIEKDMTLVKKVVYTYVGFEIH